MLLTPHHTLWWFSVYTWYFSRAAPVVGIHPLLKLLVMKWKVSPTTFRRDCGPATLLSVKDCFWMKVLLTCFANDWCKDHHGDAISVWSFFNLPPAIAQSLTISEFSKTPHHYCVFIPLGHSSRDINTLQRHTGLFANHNCLLAQTAIVTLNNDA
jgi:hypothetical protein